MEKSDSDGSCYGLVDGIMAGIIKGFPVHSLCIIGMPDFSQSRWRS